MKEHLDILVNDDHLEDEVEDDDGLVPVPGRLIGVKLLQPLHLRWTDGAKRALK